MKYTSSSGQEYSIKMNGDTWRIRYAPHWKVYKDFTCSNDEHIRQLFFHLETLKNCTSCRGELSTGSDPLCKECNARARSAELPKKISECPVCYEYLLDILDNRVTLVCGHELCKQCTNKIAIETSDMAWDPEEGAAHLVRVKCSLCRKDTHVTPAFRAVYFPDLFF
jgi:hypothetical protein